MGDPRCKWVCDRLPLLAGDELFGAERRRVERHLIGCPQCRAHGAALTNALGVLHAASGESPTRADAPSLWPGLARQMQESRRPVSPPAWSFGRNWPRLVLAAALLVALGVTDLARRQEAGARTRMAEATRPLPALVVRHVPPPAAPAPVPAPVAERVAQAESSTPARYDYVLEHGTPMGPDAADSKTRPSY